MTWDEYKQTINLITLLKDVFLELDHVEKQVDDAVDRISEALDK